MKIGFVGLGIMGRPMALNILKGGFDLTVWARRAESMAPLLEAGAKGAASAQMTSCASSTASDPAPAPRARTPNSSPPSTGTGASAWRKWAATPT